MRTIKICMLLGIVVLAGCASNSVTVLRDDTFQSSKMASLACLPFVKGRSCTEASSGGNALLDCRLSAINYPVEFYSAGASEEISHLLHDELQKKYGPALKDYKRQRSCLSEELSAKQPRSTLRSLSQQPVHGSLALSMW